MEVAMWWSNVRELNDNVPQQETDKTQTERSRNSSEKSYYLEEIIRRNNEKSNKWLSLRREKSVWERWVKEFILLCLVKLF